VCRDARPSSQCAQIGLDHSRSRLVSQFAAFTSGGPDPDTAYATRTPSGDTQYRICCAGRVLDSSRPASSATNR
jgi:hypothetical protein